MNSMIIPKKHLRFASIYLKWAFGLHSGIWLLRQIQPEPDRNRFINNILFQTYMRNSPIPSSLFEDRRKEFAKKMEPGSIAVFYSNEQMPRSGDQFFPFRQDSAIFALTGLNQPGTILALYPDAKKNIHREMVFILP